MMNNKLIPYKENIFTKISSFFKKLFFRGKRNSTEDIGEKSLYNNYQKDYFIQNIVIKENEEEKRIKNLQMQFDNGEIDDEDISDEDMDKLIELYNKETEELNRETENIKIHIAQMLRELKKN